MSTMPRGFGPIRGAALGFLLVTVLSSGGCSDPTDLDELPSLSEGLSLSDPMPNVDAVSLARGARGQLAFSIAAQVAAEIDVTYISLPPGSFPAGAFARIQSARSPATVTAPMIDGGFDPIPIAAQAGDSVEIDILNSSLVTLDRTGGKVPAKRRPRVVRTVPPRGKTDVAVNAAIVVVFSEPVDQRSLSSSSVRLFRGANAVVGTVRLLEGVTAAAVFEPSQALDPQSEYRLVVTQGVTDLTGDALEEEVTVTFVTGSTGIGATYTVSILPDTSVVAPGSQVQLTAMAADSLGRPVTGRPTLWTSETPTLATVSATGLVTARAEGLARIRAQIDGRSAVAIMDVSRSIAPVASVEVQPKTSTVVINGYVQLHAILRDAAGNIVRLRPVTWESSAPGVATVAAGSGGTALVTGVSRGAVTITARSEGRSDTATVVVGTVGPYTSIHASSDHTCALSGERAWCWGANWTGSLGNGTAVEWTLAPTAVAGGHRFSQIAEGNGGCALTPEGAAFCWGANRGGQLGIGSATGPESCAFGGGVDGANPCSTVPVPVTGGHTFGQIAVGGGDVCALTTAGATYCWGSHSSGLLGTATAPPQVCGEITAPFHCHLAPTPVASGFTFVTLTLGSGHGCAVAPDGAAYCWGANHTGQLGDSSRRNRIGPVRVAGGHAFVTLSAGYSHTCGLTADRTAYCWGNDNAGQLGNGTNDVQSCDGSSCSDIPVRVAGDLRWTFITTGLSHSCGVTTTGAAYCWGSNNGGELGDGTHNFANAPRAVSGGLTFLMLSASEHTCGVTVSGTAYCWGNNWNGRLGDGTRGNERLVPVRVAGQP